MKKINKKTPLISIITVCLNSEKYIEQTIKSIINQNYKNIEYIIIDGGSTDRTLNIIKKYKKYITTWITEPDNGIYDAMNKGIDKANGELIAFLNSDDFYFPEALMKIIEKYRQSNADVLCGKLAIINNKGEIININDSNISKLDENNFTLTHPNTFVKTKLMKKFKFDTSYKIAADRKFLRILFKKGYSFINIDYTTTAFRKGGVSSHKWIRMKEKIKIDKEMFGTFKTIKLNYKPFFEYWIKQILIKLLGKNRCIKVKNELINKLKH